MEGIIYLVTNKINNKVYVGQTINTLNRRRINHLAAARNENDNLYFHRAIKKYGEENFDWKVLDKANNQEELNNLECFYIKKY